jgi:hypothetical protein
MSTRQALVNDEGSCLLRQGRSCQEVQTRLNFSLTITAADDVDGEHSQPSSSATACESTACGLDTPT